MLFKLDCGELIPGTATLTGSHDEILSALKEQAVARHVANGVPEELRRLIEARRVTGV